MEGQNDHIFHSIIDPYRRDNVHCHATVAGGMLGCAVGDK